MRQISLSKSVIAAFLLLMVTGTVFAQPDSGMMMDHGMMMSGCSGLCMAVCVVFGILLFILLILGILALWKYLFGKKA
jgi:hypothetical protein